jgi:uncharacterized protein (DUF362 family)
MAKVTKIKVDKDLKESIRRAVEELGGFSSFVKKGEVVLLKPNFNTQDPYPASTDAAFLKAVVELVYEQDPKGVIIGESSTLSLNTRRVMEDLGVYELLKMPVPPRIYNFDERAWVKKEIPNAEFLKTVKVPKFLDRADKLILLPCLKTHNLAQFTGALKLSVGFMKPYQRTPLHLWHLQEKVAELNTLINPVLVIMDARKCFINKGPDRGKIKEPELILASRDRVAVDIEGVKIIQSYRGNSLKNIKPEDIVQIKKALELKVGQFPD